MRVTNRLATRTDRLVERLIHDQDFPPNALPCRFRFSNRIVRRLDMIARPTITLLRLVAAGVAAVLPLLVLSCGTLAEEKLSQPVYRVANETPAAQPAVTTATSVA